jgi:hypothetical protein
MITNQTTENQKGTLPSSLTETQKTYLNAWLMMKVSAENSVTLFGKHLIKKEWEGYAKTFGLKDFASLPENEQNTLYKDWVSFFEAYCTLCLTDHTYGSMLFGLIKAKDADLKEKLAYELDRMSCIFPEKLGLKDVFAPLQKASEEAYYSVVK